MGASLQPHGHLLQKYIAASASGRVTRLVSYGRNSEQKLFGTWGQAVTSGGGGNGGGGDRGKAVGGRGGDGGDGLV